MGTSRNGLELRTRRFALQEIEETRYWPELLIESGTVAPDRLGPVRKEADELVAMFAASVRTAKRNRTRSP